MAPELDARTDAEVEAMGEADAVATTEPAIQVAAQDQMAAEYRALAKGNRSPRADTRLRSLAMHSV